MPLLGDHPKIPLLSLFCLKKYSRFLGAKNSSCGDIFGGNKTARLFLKLSISIWNSIQLSSKVRSQGACMKGFLKFTLGFVSEKPNRPNPSSPFRLSSAKNSYNTHFQASSSNCWGLLSGNNSVSSKYFFKWLTKSTRRHLLDITFSLFFSKVLIIILRCNICI